MTSGKKPHRKKNSTMCRKYRPASIEGFPVTCSYLLSLHSFKLEIMLIDFGIEGAEVLMDRDFYSRLEFQ